MVLKEVYSNTNLNSMVNTEEKNNDKTIGISLIFAISNKLKRKLIYSVSSYTIVSCHYQSNLTKVLFKSFVSVQHVMSCCFIILAFSIFFSKFQNDVPMLQMNYELYILHNISSGHFFIKSCRP